jgi:hypothetical protein
MSIHRLGRHEAAHSHLLLLLRRGGLLMCQLLFTPLFLSFDHFLVQEWLDADAARFGSEMPPEGVSTGKASAAAPLTTGFQVTLAYELLLPGVKTLVAFAVVLPCKSFAANGTDEWTFVGMGTQVRAQVVGARKSLRA